MYIFQYNLLFSSLSSNRYSLLLHSGELYFILKCGLILEAKQKGNIWDQQYSEYHGKNTVFEIA